ncbi:hypothetical protein T310_10287, partial [Rasamsonia emersonii CBS 393.64]
AFLYRTRLPPLSPRSTRRPRRWCPRASGCHRATRFVFTAVIFSVCVILQFANGSPPTGEIRRPVPAVNSADPYRSVCIYRPSSHVTIPLYPTCQIIGASQLGMCCVWLRDIGQMCIEPLFQLDDRS